MSDANDQQKELLLKLVRDVVAQDEMLRAKFGVGDKFRFIREKLQAILQQTEEQVARLAAVTETKQDMIAAHESLVYVYLFNAQGALVPTWQKMLKPSLFYEYSVNRPIYRSKEAIDTYIRAKSNRQQHAYLTVIIDNAAILSSSATAEANDDMPIRVKEGSLHFNKMICFTHNGEDYQVNELGEIKKASDAI